MERVGVFSLASVRSCLTSLGVHCFPEFLTRVRDVLVAATEDQLSGLRELPPAATR